MPLVWRLHMRTSQKLALSGVCGLVLVTVAFEIVRSVKLSQANFHLTTLYGYLQLLVAVIIGMLPPYRLLLFNSERRREYRGLFWYRLTLWSGQPFHSRERDSAKGDTELVAGASKSSASASDAGGLIAMGPRESGSRGDFREYRMEGRLVR